MPSHHHQTSNLKGGIEIDESTLDDNAKYWKEGALWAYDRIEEIIGEEKLNSMVDKFWNNDYTWKEICLMTKNLLKEYKK